ncbi:hypothetical protein QP028_05435 [Corynebacterium suedekumii]|nr:hypothetical protein QP028_05435 [Corynebacterium suedekumii]
MNDKKMLIGMQIGNGYGAQATSWMADNVDVRNYTNLDAHVRYAQAAERGTSSSCSYRTSWPRARRPTTMLPC